MSDRVSDKRPSAENTPADDHAKPVAHAETSRHGPGPFVTRVVMALGEGRQLVATSRRHRKGLAPRECPADDAQRIPPTLPEAWRHFWAPERPAWWIAVFFVVGSACFGVGGWAVTWPAEAPAPLNSAATANGVFFVGSIFFTIAAYLQLREAANGDVADAPGPRRAGLRWLGWKPHNLGWLASAFQLLGAIAFNFSAGDAMLAGLGWEEEDLLVWTPNMLGCGCFLVSSTLAWVELSHRLWSFAPRSASWWVVVLNEVGSVAFLLSAVYTVVLPGLPDAHALWLGGFYTFLGGLFFLMGSYLLIPELFDGEARGPAPAFGRLAADNIA